ncbi:MAG: TonB-dependent receptor plug domain-containing protein [Methylococcales bacterium]|nr:TonB-dependent receptor plug domain-containing protein [Methylococcales bacterium]
MKKLVFIKVILSLTYLVSTSPIAQDKPPTPPLEETSLADLLNMEMDAQASIGSRGKAVDLLEAKVPVDVITAEEIKHSGYTELSKVLQRFIPGFNFPRPFIRDGSDHIRPFTLRGMSPDQVLVLINGKRVHNSSLLHVNGTIGRGSTGSDLNTIPLASIARIEVLRDGAAAQYGSDAIAGILNIILKSGGEERRISSTVGQTYQSDGELYQTDIHYGIGLPLDGFIDLTAELRDRNPTNRTLSDTRQQYFEGDIRNNNPPTQNDRGYQFKTGHPAISKG